MNQPDRRVRSFSLPQSHLGCGGLSPTLGVNNYVFVYKKGKSMLSSRKIIDSGLLLVILSVSGCATVYTPPTSGSLARMKFERSTGYALIDEGNSCGTRHIVPSKDWVNIRAGKRIWIEQGFDSRGTAFGMYCGLALSFEPIEGATYVSEYQLIGMKCQMALYRITDSGERIREQSATRTNPRSCF